MEIKDIIECKRKICNNILITLGESTLKKYRKINFIELEEKIQILFQILLNIGYKIIILPVNKDEIEYCKKFIYLFQSQNIKLFSHISNNKSIIEIMRQCNLFINFEVTIQHYFLNLEKPCILMVSNEQFKKYQNIYKSNKVFLFDTNKFKIDKIINKIEEFTIINNYKNTKCKEYPMENMGNNEFEVCKKQAKKNIIKLVNNNKLDDAKNLIEEYENIVKDDIEIYSIRSVIYIMEKNIKKALKIIEEGLSLSPKNLELLYNKAYILENIKDYKTTYKLYQQMLHITNNEQLKKRIIKKLKEIKSIDNYVDLNGKLSLLLVNKNTNQNIYNYVIHWLSEFGFTIINTLKVKNLIINKFIIKDCIFLYDLNPEELNLCEKNDYPNIDNKRYFLINSLQKQINIEFGIKNINDYLYLTKNEQEAKVLIEKLLGENSQKFYKNIVKIEEDYRTKYPILKLFDGFRHRAKTELIKYKDTLAVKKTWKPGNDKYFKREKFAYTYLSKNIKLIPKIIESGKNYIIIPYYQNILNKSDTLKKRILTIHIVQIAFFLKQLYESGYFNTDMHPGQFIFSEKEGLKAIDFEYLQEYKNKPSSFIESYDIKGYPKDFKGDKPNYIGKDLHKLYNNLWVKYTGYNLKQIADIAIGDQYKNNDIDINKILGLLNYAKTSGKSYNGIMYGSAYHSIRLKQYYFRGQRECSLRLQKVPYDFSNKIVLDIGCNAGGMLHSISDEIKMGIGLDYDYRLINAANAIKTINKSHNLSFYRFDLENEDLNLIYNYILCEDKKVNICFLLSICMWIKNWRKVIKFVSTISENLLFETNGTYEQQTQQIEELKENYKIIEIIQEHSDDDPGQSNRKLLFCKN